MNAHNDIIPLIPQEKKFTAKLKRIASVASQGALSVVGLGAGALYFYPAKICATSATCGLWMSKLTSEQIAIGVFTAGGIDFAGINAFFAGKSILMTVEAIQTEKTVIRKIAKGTFIIGFALTQNVQNFIVSATTSENWIEMAITLGGAAPSSLYGASGMTEHELKYIFSLATKLSRNLHYLIVDRCIDPTEAELQMRRRIRFYEGQQSQFLKHVNAKWRDLYLHTNNLAVTRFDDGLNVLFNHQDYEKTLLQKMAHGSSTLLGLILGTNVSIPFVKNSFSFVTKYIPFLPLQIATACFLSAASIYGNLKLSVNGVSAILDTFVDILSGNSIQSLTYQLRPKTTTAMAGLAFMASVFSFAVMNYMTESELPGNDELHDGFRWSTNIAMIIYHFGGILHLYELLLNNFTCNDKEKFIFALQHTIEKLQNMSLDQFIEFTEKNSAEQNELYGLETYSEDDIENQDAHAEDVVERVEEEIEVEPTTISIVGEVPVALPERQSWLGSWCCWFKGESSTDKGEKFEAEKDQKETPDYSV